MLLGYQGTHNLEMGQLYYWDIRERNLGTGQLYYWDIREQFRDGTAIILRYPVNT
jgi:hypothetical protein